MVEVMREAQAAEARPYHHGDLRRALLDAALPLIREGGPEALTLRAPTPSCMGLSLLRVGCGAVMAGVTRS